jgi:phosphinothricin acetyltransferase
MTILIRPCREEDMPAITAIYGRSVLHETASWEYEAPDEAEMRRRRADVLAKGFPYLVAEAEGNAVGYAYASTYRARIGYRFVVEDSVYVAQGMQGRGIGKQLLLALIAECARLGFRQMVAVIGDSNNAGSIKLHEACGFTHAALFKGIGFKFDRWLDSVQMQRAL